jgi:hypothetical protein
VVEKMSTPEQSVYRVGVMAIRGIETAFDEFSQTFSNYLSLTVGNRFDPPISFETVPVAFTDIVDRLSTYDFVYANPSVFSCIESEVGANSLVSQIALRTVGGEKYSHTQFGGVIFTRADNDQVNRIEDIKGKRVATVSITGLGSGQMQFREFQRAGLHHLQDPEQLLFTGGQGKVVKSVLNGQVESEFQKSENFATSSTGPFRGHHGEMDCGVWMNACRSCSGLLGLCTWTPSIIFANSSSLTAFTISRFAVCVPTSVLLEMDIKVSPS